MECLALLPLGRSSRIRALTTSIRTSGCFCLVSLKRNPPSSLPLRHLLLILRISCTLHLHIPNPTHTPYTHLQKWSRLLLSAPLVVSASPSRCSSSSLRSSLTSLSTMCKCFRIALWGAVSCRKSRRAWQTMYADNVPRSLAMLSFHCVNAPGVAADVSHINTPSLVTGYLSADGGLGKALKNADIVVIPAGVPRKPGMTRDDLFNVSRPPEHRHRTFLCKSHRIALLCLPVHAALAVAGEGAAAHMPFSGIVFVDGCCRPNANISSSCSAARRMRTCNSFRRIQPCNRYPHSSRAECGRVDFGDGDENCWSKRTRHAEHGFQVGFCPAMPACDKPPA